MLTLYFAKHSPQARAFSTINGEADLNIIIQTTFFVFCYIHMHY